MTTDVEYALAKVGTDTFEKLASDVLRDYGYEVNPSGVHGSDGGRDAFVKINGKPGIAHYSTQKTWRRKLRSDAAKVADHDNEYEWFVFVTNQEVTGQQEAEMRREIRDEFGWELDFWHHERLRNRLEIDLPEVARRHLGVNPQTRDDTISTIDRFKNERINAIRDRRELPIQLVEGPFVAIHLFPTGMQSMDYEVFPSDLPTPPEYGKEDAPFDGKPVEDGKLTVRHNNQEAYRKYTFIHEDGWMEAVSTDLLVRGQDTKEMFHAHRFDMQVVKTVRGCLDCLEEVGSKPPIFVYVTVSGFKDIEMYYTNDIWGPDRVCKIPKDEMAIKKISIDSFDDDIPQALKPIFDRFWNGCGWSTGCVDYNDGNWDPYYRRY